MDLVGLFFALIRNALDGKPLPEEWRSAITAETLVPLYRLAKHHDLAHLVGAALKKNGWLFAESEATPKFEKQMMLAVFRYERLRETLAELRRLLTEARVRHLPLKGSVLRDLYPEPWMRTSCDIDILIPREELEQAQEALCASGYRVEGQGDHDVSLFSPSRVHVELHYALMGERDVPSAAHLLSDVWPRLRASEDGFGYEMTDALFYLYHLSHMAKHICNGGCGVRPFLDLYVLSGIPHDKEARQATVADGGLAAFAAIAERLSYVFFDGAEYDEETKALARYVLGGGVYGTMENRVTIGQSRKGGKLKYLLSRIFLPYAVLKYQYPILQKHRWLTPLYEVRRWGRLLFRGGIRRSVREIKTTGGVSDAGAENSAYLLSILGLQ